MATIVTYNAFGEVYNCKILYRRSGPGVMYGTNGTYDKGYTVAITKKCSTGWYYVDDKGWCISSYIKISSTKIAGTLTLDIACKMYESKSTSSKEIMTFVNGCKLKYSERSGNWYKVSTTNNGKLVTGWVYIKNITTGNTSNTNNTNNTITKASEEVQELSNEDAKVLYKSFLTYYSESESSIESLLTNNLNGIHGIPYQFMSTVDPKLTGSNFGAIYAEKIVSSLPILLMTPGQVEFMTDYQTSQKEGMLQLLNDVSNGDSKFTSDDISSILGDQDGKYYSFAFAYEDYWKYVNTLMHACAIFQGIQDVKVKFGGSDPVALGKVDWRTANNTSFNSYLSSTRDTIAFYIDSCNSIDENFSNELTDSQLASKVNSFSDYGREIRYLLGYGAGSKQLDSFLESNEDAFNDAISTVADVANKFLGEAGNLFKSIGNAFSTVAEGGKISFPQIWSDSSFSRSYNINMKLRCPEPNPVSWHLDICAPLIHLLAMTMPRQSSNVNGYTAPFLVRAFYKGLFSCDMGIISNVSISKGKEGAWTVDGLPTQVDVSFEIKDLYNVLFMTDYSTNKWFMNNTCLLNYLATSCGININEVDMVRDLTLFLMLHRDDTPVGIVKDQFSQVRQAIDNKLLKMYENNIIKKIN